MTPDERRKWIEYLVSVHGRLGYGLALAFMNSLEAQVKAVETGLADTKTRDVILKRSEVNYMAVCLRHDRGYTRRPCGCVG